MERENRRLRHQKMFMSAFFARPLLFGVVIALVVFFTVHQLAAQSTGVCALLQPADVTPLLAGTGPVVGTEMGPMCTWNAPGTQRYLAVQFLPVDKKGSADSIYDRERKQAGNDPTLKDEPRMGDRAFSTISQFVVLKKGRIIRVFFPIMDMARMADAKYMEQVRDTARPTIKKAADAM